jgi:hypothetical protein
VDELHSIENRGDKVARKVLTSSVAGVKTHSFFDSFAVVFSRQRLRAEASSLRLRLRVQAQKNRNGRQQSAG